MPLFSNSTSDAENMYKSIYNTYRDRIFYYIAGKVRDRNDIFDILQNVFVHLWQYRDTLGGQNTENIVFKTCNQEISNFVKQKSKNPLDTSSLVFEQTDDSEKLLEVKLEEEELLEDLTHRIEKLPPLRKQIFTMNKLEGISQQQIADELNLSRSAVENQISKALLFLKNHQNDP